MWLPPFQEPDMLNLAETKAHLRIDHCDEGAHTEAPVDAATASVADCPHMAVEDMELAPLPAPVRAAIADPVARARPARKPRGVERQITVREPATEGSGEAGEGQALI